MSKRIKIRWTCPLCRHKHRWKWFKDEYKEAVNSMTWMKCEACGRDSHMGPDAPDDWRWDGDWRKA